MKKGLTYKILFAWLLLLTYLLNPLRVYQPYLNYSVNYSYISTVLCENKEKPQLHCEGKCHLNKSLKKNAEEESKNQSSSVRNIQVEEIPNEKSLLQFSHLFLLKEAAFISYSERSYSANLKHTNPPPKF